MKKALSLIIALPLMAGLFLSNPAVVTACSCAQLQTVSEKASYSDAVFRGKVISTNRDELDEFSLAPDPLRYVFKIIEYWQGDVTAEMTVRTAASSAACGEYFDVGEEYIVYTARNQGYDSTGLCSGNTKATEADLTEAEAELGQGKKVESQPTKSPIPTEKPGPNRPGLAPGPTSQDMNNFLYIWLVVVTAVVCFNGLLSLLLLFKVLRAQKTAAA